MFSAIALICKYVTKGWKEVQLAYSDKENSEEVVKVLSYLEVVEKVKHSCDETEVINLIEEHKLEREQLLTDHLKSKQVGGSCWWESLTSNTSESAEKQHCIVRAFVIWKYFFSHQLIKGYVFFFWRYGELC